MDQAQAQRVIESLRKGIPPDGFVRHFTVGRASEVAQLTERLDDVVPGALLLKANYGSGKTHLLRFIRECALEKGFAVSAITLDSKSGVRFNRMDQVFGATLRCIELPRREGRGPGVLFGALLDTMTSPCLDTSRKAELDALSSMGLWDYSQALKSPAMYVGIRAWIIGQMNGHNYGMIPQEVEGWLCEPWNYYTRTQWLYERFVRGLRRFFRDPRAAWQFHRRGTDTFSFKASDYRQSWDALADLDLLAKLVGLKGLVLLVDEFEDVLYNLNRIDYQCAAFWNLFRLFRGDFPGLSFYAVTPHFIRKCKQLLQRKGCVDYDYSQFDSLPTFEISPLKLKDMRELCLRVIDTHGVAYGWDTKLLHAHPDVERIVRELSQEPVQDRTRNTITTLVRLLDAWLQGD